MPGYDGTGPQGMGPMTGGARGRCNSAAGGYPAGYGFGRGMAYGRGAGLGRGLRRGFRAGGGMPGYPPASVYGAESELTVLKSQATAMKNTLDEINRRIAELDKTTT